MANLDLVRHNETQFKKSIVKLSPGIWTAVGYAASTQHLIEGNSSLTIVDTSESTGAANNVLAEFRKLTDKPIERIIYTHSHRDHISGASVFAEGRDIPIIASAAFQSDLVGRDVKAIAPNKALNRRTQAQFGFGLNSEQRISLGCGPGDRPMEGMGAGHIPPTVHIENDQDMDLDGVRAQFVLAPGETADHMAVWLPDVKVLIPGDNWYHAFPNLYAIRGTPYRDYAAWANSLALLEALGAIVLAPGHTMPVFGADKVSEVLSTTRAAILHVMQHTADGMDAGLSMDDIAASIELPADIARPWLGEFYGKASWSTRAFATGTLGWYDGNPTHLGTLSDVQRAERMATLVGGVQALNKAASDTESLQWRMELCDHLIALGQPNAKQLKAETMQALAEDEINATARNTYLWCAAQLRKELDGE